MKIAFCVSVPFAGGGERIQNLLIEEFDKLGNEVIVYTWEESWMDLKELFPASIHILSSPPIGIAGKFKAYRELKGMLIRDRPDCLMVFSLYLAEIAALSAKIAGIPSITSERVDPYYLPEACIHRCLKKFTYNLCKGVVFQTQEVKAYFSKNIQDKSVVIQNPIIDDDLPVVNVNCHRDEIVAIGRLSEEKNFEMLIEAFAEIQKHIPSYSLKIFGDGPLFQKLNSLVMTLGISSKVSLMGKVDRVIDHISGADIFILSSNHEGMPNALIEAMAMGLACISTDVRSGGAHALINHMENGILTPVGDKEAIKEAILLVANNPKLKNSLKRCALAIRKTNSKDVILPLWISYIQSKL